MHDICNRDDIRITFYHIDISLFDINKYNITLCFITLRIYD
jgi:hypothetical protein